jgi:hypothetical protein
MGGRSWWPGRRSVVARRRRSRGCADGRVSGHPVGNSPFVPIVPIVPIMAIMAFFHLCMTYCGGSNGTSECKNNGNERLVLHLKEVVNE